MKVIASALAVNVKNFARKVHARALFALQSVGYLAKRNSTLGYLRVVKAEISRYRKGKALNSFCDNLGIERIRAL